MDASMVFSRSGTLEDDTGLFVLEGANKDFLLSSATVGLMGRSPTGYEFQSTAVFQEDRVGGGPLFINKRQGYSKKKEHMSILLHNATKTADGSEDLSRVAKLSHGVYGQMSIKKLAEKKYVTDFFGISPAERAIKVVLRECGVATKRTVLFALGVPPGSGGKSWVVSPYGFSWVEDKNILVAGEMSDLDVLDTKVLGTKIFPYFLVTNAVPFFSGHRKRAPDEPHPKILQFSPDAESSYSWNLAGETIKSMLRSDDMGYGFSFLKSLLEATERHGEKSKVRVETCFGLSDQVVSLDDDTLEEMF